MSLEVYAGIAPTLGERVYVHPQACVIGKVALGDDVSIWPFAVARGDVQTISIGARTSIQDGSVLHVTHDGPYNPGGFPLVVGADVTVGHRVTLHGCEIGDGSLIGMGATVMDGAVVGEGVLLAAGSLVTQGKVLEAGHLYQGSPVRRIRALSDDERERLLYGARRYVALKDEYLK